MTIHLQRLVIAAQMRIKQLLPVLLPLSAIFLWPLPLFSAAMPPRGVSGDLWADRILGQPEDGTLNYAFGEVKFNEANSKNLNNPTSAFVDRAHDILYLVDSANSRVLGVNNITSAVDGQGADFVLGQDDFIRTAANGDSNWQTFDAGLGFSSPPVLATAFTLCGIDYRGQSPQESAAGGNMAVDGLGNLYLPDIANNRVLRYEFPVSTHQAASHVWGQLSGPMPSGTEDFTTSAPNEIGWNVAGGPTSINLSFSPAGDIESASGVAIDAWGCLWVADEQNNRVLRFPNHKGVGGVPDPAADAVLGQADFFSRDPATGSADKAHLRQPTAIRADSQGNIYVTEAAASFGRISIYRPTGTDGSGLPEYGTTNMGQPAAFTITQNLQGPVGMEMDPARTYPQVGLWVTDQKTQYTTEYLVDWSPSYSYSLGASIASGDCRGAAGAASNGDLYISSEPGMSLTRYTGGVPGASVFRQPSGAAGTPNKIGPVGFYHSDGVVVAAWAGVTQVVVADQTRLHIWDITSSGAAGLNNGQPESDYAGSSAPFAFDPGNGIMYGEVAADAAGHLWAVQGTNPNRVDAFTLPLSSAQVNASATLTSPVSVLGYGAASWTGISGMTLDGEGNVWISDQADSRVLRVRNPLTSPVVDIILGQSNWTSKGCNGNGTIVPYAANGGCPGGTIITAGTLNQPGCLKMDHHGDLFVSDNSLETEGNGRLLRWDAKTLPSNPALCQFAIPADGVYGTNGSFTVGTGGLTPFDSSFWEVAFNQDDSFMVGGTNSQSGSGYPPVILQNPLNGVRPAGTPDDPGVGDTVYGHLNDFGPQSFALTFDAQDNLYVAELNRNRALVYLQPFPIAQATATGTQTPVSPTPSFTTTSTATPGCFQIKADFTGQSGGFNHPTGVAVDMARNYLYIADSGGNRVQVYAYSQGAAPVPLTTIGNGVSGSLSFSTPVGVAVDGEGNIFTAEAGGQVQKFSFNGTTAVLESVIGSGAVGSPQALCVDGNGTVYILNDTTVYVYQPTCPNVYVQKASFNGPGAKPFVTARGLCKSGNVVYVADTGNGRIEACAETVVGSVFSYGYSTMNLGSAPSLGPYGIAADLAGNFYLSSFPNSYVLGFSVNFSWDHIVQIPGNAYAVATDQYGDVFATGYSGNNVVEIMGCVPEPTFTPTGSPTPAWSCGWTATTTPTATVTPSPTATGSPTLSPTTSSTATPTPTASVTPTPTPTDSPTPTSTPTVTLTPTPSPTPTLTFIPTASPTPVPAAGIGPPYPNPVRENPVSFDISVPGPTTVKWRVYTAAFRKIFEDSRVIASKGTLAWDLMDQGGAPVANGLYYLKVDIAGPDPMARISKVIVAR